MASTNCCSIYVGLIPRVLTTAALVTLLYVCGGESVGVGAGGKIVSREMRFPHKRDLPTVLCRKHITTTTKRTVTHNTRTRTVGMIIMCECVCV